MKLKIQFIMDVYSAGDEEGETVDIDSLSKDDIFVAWKDANEGATHEVQLLDGTCVDFYVDDIEVVP